jgi:hypothetical protein
MRQFTFLLQVAGSARRSLFLDFNAIHILAAPAILFAYTQKILFWSPRFCLACGKKQCFSSTQRKKLMIKIFSICDFFNALLPRNESAKIAIEKGGALNELFS